MHNMATRRRINITLHPLEIKKLDNIAEENDETRSGMISRLIQEYQLKTHKKKEKKGKISKEDAEWIGEKTEMSYYYNK